MRRRNGCSARSLNVCICSCGRRKCFETPSTTIAGSRGPCPPYCRSPVPRVLRVSVVIITVQPGRSLRDDARRPAPADVHGLRGGRRQRALATTARPSCSPSAGRRRARRRLPASATCRRRATSASTPPRATSSRSSTTTRCPSRAGSRTWPAPTTTTRGRRRGRPDARPHRRARPVPLLASATASARTDFDREPPLDALQPARRRPVPLPAGDQLLVPPQRARGGRAASTRRSSTTTTRPRSACSSSTPGSAARARRRRRCTTSSCRRTCAARPAFTDPFFAIKNRAYFALRDGPRHACRRTCWRP